MKLDAWSASDIGLVRKSNQDSVGCFPDLNIFVVADGMGGHADGEIASRTAVETVHAFFDGQRPGKPTGWAALAHWFKGLLRVEKTEPIPAASERQQLETVVRLANQRIYQLGHQNPDPEKRPMGTTVVVLKLVPDQLRASWTHVGDSRLYRARDGQLALLTADHTAYGEPYANQSVVPTDLAHTNTLNQALGVYEEVVIPTKSDEMRPGDLFLLCSDGLSSMVDAAGISAQLANAQNLEETGQALIRLAMEGGGRDNASVVLVKVVDELDPDRTQPQTN